MDSLITKRLHVSGLTPSLSPADLSQRLSTFGTVKALDGFGLPDGVGRPRKFGYVTIETTAPKLAKCFNLLSGSTWKGAKLRIGEAKPDFTQRLQRERENPAEPPKKKRKRMGGTHAEDMSLVTRENAERRGGWKVTPLGRIMRPVKMRPERPLALPDISEVNKASRKKGGKDEKKRKRREKNPDVRARRRMIDMTRWGSVHLKGMFLDVDVRGHINGLDEQKAVVEDGTESDAGEMDEEVDGREVDGVDEVIERMSVTNNERQTSTDMSHRPLSPTTKTAVPPKSMTTTYERASESPITTSLPADHTDVILEKNRSLHLLQSLFGAQDDGEWGGRESVGSDIDEELIKAGEGGGGTRMDGEGAAMGLDFEVVPMDVDVGLRDARHEEEEGEAEAEKQEVGKEPATEKERQATKLKDLFAPREEEGFSLLGHLDIDLELDDEVLFPASTQGPAAIPDTVSTLAPAFTASTSHIAQPYAHTQLTLDPKQALFFPLASSFPLDGSSSAFPTKARSKDLFDVARENGWNWRDPKVGFWRTGTEKEIKERWEAQKVELTREWKRRCREAGKVRRRKDVGIEAED